MMPADSIPMPPASILREDLRVTTERIAHELAWPSTEAPDWNDIQWRVAMAVAVMHGVSALLAGRLRWRGPQTWTTFLAQQGAQGILRQSRTQQLLAEIDGAARDAGIPLVALKGSALLDLNLYAPGERPMSDIDLLCTPQDFEATGRVIESLGYVARVTNWRHREYQPADTGQDRAFGEHIANPVKIELHPRIVERLPLRDVDVTAQIFPTPARVGLNPYPAAAALMRHLLLHAAGSICGKFIRLIHLHDIASLANRMCAEDWGALMLPEEGAWWMLPPLAMVNRYFPDRIPPAFLDGAAGQCPTVLRWAARRYRITEVSPSRLETPMLPGWEWSRSTAEAIGWAFKRLYPGRNAVALVQKMAFDNHALATMGWAQLSRWKKGMRILSGRAPRAATMYSVRRALDYTPPAVRAPYSASTRVKV
ncbi:MAG TPA: nucleotidyltransferase family protein [Burkholderiaceae bacterium]|nr:nucleotidyltransferase family protein [Burkholderiaceae bacterium]